MKPYRSMLFVPGHKPDWVDKGLAAGADALILDLEDSVAPALKPEGRAAVAATLARADLTGGDLWVRPNPLASGLLGSDLEAIVSPNLAGLLLPKLSGPEDVVRIDAVLDHLERREGLPPGAIGLIASFETAESIAACEAIAGAVPRMQALFGATGPEGDIARALGFEFTPGGQETLYLRSRIVLAARAAGLHHPLCGLWPEIRDLEGLRTFCEDNRRLGYRGLVAIHPSHVAVAHAVFTPSADVVERCRRMLAAFQRARAQGDAAVDFEGQMVDIAHVTTARGIIELADAIANQ